MLPSPMNATRAMSNPYLPGPLARALLDERGHAFLLVLGAEQAVEQAALEIDALRQRHLERGVDHFLGRDRGERGHAGDRLRRSSALRRAARRRGRPWRPARRARLPRRPSSARSGTSPSPWPCRSRSVSRCDPPMPGVTPSLISGWPNLAVSAAMMKSAIIATSQPPPSAKPDDRRDPRLAGRA